MKTLIVYDATGYIYFQMAGSYRVPEGVNYLEVEIPEGKYIGSVNVTVTPHSPVYENIPEALEQSMKNLKDENGLLKGCVMELANIVYSSTTTGSEV